MTGHLSFEVMYSVAHVKHSDNDMLTMEIRDVSGISEAREIALKHAEALHAATPEKTYTISEIVNIF